MNQTRLTRRRLLQGTAGLTVVGLAGCTGSTESAPGTTGSGSGASGDPPGHGDSEHSHGGVGEPQDAREVAVNTARGGETTEYHFDPHVTRVTVGGTVTWRLESGTHTATAYHPGNDQPRLVPEGTDAWDSGTLSEQGQTYEHTFETEGIYHYYCEPHEQFGMLGTVIVGNPDPDQQVALQTVPENKPEEVRGKLRRLNEMCRSALEGDHHDDGGHHDGTTTETEHHEDDGHHEGETTETSHHDEEGHHEGETTASGHHEGTATESGHHEEEDGHHDGETTESGHHG